MKISILITTYNLEKYIEETLKSVFSLEINCSYEVLIGDDGSTDGTIDLAQKWRNSYPDIVRLFTVPREERKRYNSISRASQNRINLLRHATGEYVTFLDGDDVYTDKRKIQKQIDILENAANADCVMCGCNMNFWWENENRVIPIVSPDLKECKLSKKEYWEKYWIPAEAFVFRNIFSVHDVPQFMEEYFDDNIITFFYLKYGKIYYLRDNMVNYRQNPTVWKKSNRIQQSVVNAMDLTIEREYNKAMYFSCIKRHYGDFALLYKERKRFNELHLDEYTHQIEKDDLKEVKTILEFGSKRLILKIKAIALFKWMSMICWRRVLFNIYSKVYWTYWTPLKNIFIDK